MQIAKGLAAAANFDSFTAVVRNAEKSLALQDMGWTLVEVADFTDPVALETAFAGAKTVVSTFGGNDLVALEKAAIQAAKKVGASLFVPSQFGTDYRRWSTSFPLMAGKGQVLEAAKEAGLPTLSVFCGYFSDFTFGFLTDTDNAKARIVGDGSAKISFTRRSDIGYVLAKALADPKFSQGGTLSFQGQTLSWKDGIEILEGVLGKKFEIEFIDPADALKQEQELLAKGLEGDIGAFYGSFALHLLGEPARGKTGADVSADANSYGCKLETLEETLQTVYGTK